MGCFLQTAVKNPRFPKLSDRVTQLKESEEGGDGMNALLENYLEKARQEGRKEGIEEGRRIGRVKEIIRMSTKFNIADNEIQEELLKNRLLEKKKTQRSERSERCVKTSKNFIKVPERVERISNKIQGDCPVDDSPVFYGPGRGWALAPKLFLLAGTISSTASSSLLLGAKG